MSVIRKSISFFVDVYLEASLTLILCYNFRFENLCFRIEFSCGQYSMLNEYILKAAYKKMTGSKFVLDYSLI